MYTSSESTGASSYLTETAEECDFCGETVHPATAVKRAERKGDEIEVVTLCAECALSDD